ncbi:hypothetical protein, partial [Arthrobacter sp. NPDC092385]|uniref:hypothetical protein n=1 Tax=Arthrobacter sp. NPDC092385 TaxID=3363943 RepID=UPI00380A09BB
PHGVRQPANSTNQKTIGINKLGTLLSSQTTGTFDYLQSRRFRVLSGLFSFAVMFTAYFILFSLVKSSALAYSLHIGIRQDNPMTNGGQFRVRFRAHEVTAGFEGGWLPSPGQLIRHYTPRWIGANRWSVASVTSSWGLPAPSCRRSRLLLPR